MLSLNRLPLSWFAIALAWGLWVSGAGEAQMPAPPGQVAPGEPARHEAYLFAHMMEGDYGRLYYSVSLDGLHWELLNDGKRVFEDYRGHADICTGHDGRFYLVGNRGDERPDINFWVSDDLVHWQKHGDYEPDLKRVPDYPRALPRIGAPKLFFDDATRQYLLTWHTTHDLGKTSLPEPYWAGQRTLYATSKDLRTFSDPPRKLFGGAWDMATIDTIVRRVGDRCYAILKDERYPTADWPTGKTIRIASAPDLLGPYSEPGPPRSPSFREAPALIPAPNGRAWYLYYEQYPGVAYGLSASESLAGPWFQVAGSQRPDWDKFRTPPKARHGCMLPIRRSQYDALLAAFPPKPAAAQPGSGATAGEREAVDGPWRVESLYRAPAWQKIDRPGVEGVTAVMFEGLAFQGRPTRVFAWVGVPAVPEGVKVPAMVLVHGGGGTAFEEWVRLWVQRGYAAIAMDTCGQVPVGNYGEYLHHDRGGPPGWGGFNQLDAPREDQWSYHAVADVILAHSLIRSWPGVDPDRTGITGISWGGYLTCIAAGLDQRFKLAAPVYGCGFYRDCVFEGDLARLGVEQANRWLKLWDPSHYLGRASMPMLWVTGSNDFAYPLNALQSSYRLPRGPRTLCIRLRMPHAHGGAGENPEEIRVFADSLLSNGAPLPTVTGAGLQGAQAWVTFNSRGPVERAELNYTRDLGRWQDRKWDSVQAELGVDRAAAPLPAGTTVWYFNLLDARGCVVSSEHQEVRE